MWLRSSSVTARSADPGVARVARRRRDPRSGREIGAQPALPEFLARIRTRLRTARCICVSWASS